MTSKEVLKNLRSLERTILAKNRRKPAELDLDWVKSFPALPGVYAWFDEGNLVYVGESRSIRKRMSDSRHTQNHTLRRNLGSALYANYRGFVAATSKKKFPNRFEALVDKKMRTLSVAALPIEFGRTELEEYLIEKYAPAYNKKRKRK